MSRLIQLEWLKLKHYKAFWVLSSLYVLSVTLICSSGMHFLRFVKNKGGDFEGVDPTILPIYDFPDVWQNISYIALFFKIIPAFIIVITISNEAKFRTIRQNVIDGLSKREFLVSKLSLIFFVALGTTLLLFIIGLITGLIYSNVQGTEYMFQSMDFLLANFLGVFTYLTFALLLSLILPKAGLVIVGLFLYTIIFEPILAAFLTYFPHIHEGFRPIAEFLPVSSVSNLIPIPFPKYAFFEIQNFVGLKQTLIVLGWAIFNIGMSYQVLKRKDW